MTVDAGTSREVSFSVTKNTTGTYQVNLNRLVSSFIVEGKVANKWWLLAVAAAVLAVLAVPAVYLLARRRKRGKTAFDYNDQGCAHYRRGEYDAAIVDYTKAISG